MVTGFNRMLSLALSMAALFLPTCSPLPLKPENSGEVATIEITVDSEKWNELLKSSHLTEWESVHFTDSNGTVPARIRIQGGLGRKLAKKSFQVEWTDSGMTRCQPRALVISAQYLDRSLCKYRLANHFFKRALSTTPRLQHAALYVNGSFNGLYLLREPIDSHFLRRNNLRISSVYQANHNARFNFDYQMLPENGWKKQLPEDDLSFGDLEHLISTIDSGVTDHRLQNIGEILDLENTMDYLAVSYIIANRDGIVKNLHLYYNPAVGKFQIIPWDLDLTFERVPSSIASFENGLFEKLAQIPSCREYIHRRIGEIFDLDEALDTLESIANDIEPVYNRDPWLGPRPETLENQTDKIRSYLHAMKDRLVSKGIESQ